MIKVFLSDKFIPKIKKLVVSHLKVSAVVMLIWRSNIFKIKYDENKVRNALVANRSVF